MRTNARNNPKLWDKIEEGKLLFQQKYMKEANTVGFTGDFVAERLHAVAVKNANERQDFNAVQAIKTHLAFMCPKRSNEPANLVMQGVFVVPSHSDANFWTKRARAVITAPQFPAPNGAK